MTRTARTAIQPSSSEPPAALTAPRSSSLAQLDSQARLAGDVLVAEQDGALVAALSGGPAARSPTRSADRRPGRPPPPARRPRARVPARPESGLAPPAHGLTRGSSAAPRSPSAGRRRPGCWPSRPMVRVTVWGENVHERTEEPRARDLSRRHARDHRRGLEALLGERVRVRTATLEQPEHGLTADVLAADRRPDLVGPRAHDGRRRRGGRPRPRRRARRHGPARRCTRAHYSKIFRRLLGTSCSLRWRNEGERELVWTVDPAHPIAAGVPQPIVIDAQEMYGEHFDIPAPDELVFISSFAGGEVFRGGCCFRRGARADLLLQPRRPGLSRLPPPRRAARVWPTPSCGRRRRAARRHVPGSPQMPRGGASVGFATVPTPVRCAPSSRARASSARTGPASCSSTRTASSPAGSTSTRRACAPRRGGWASATCRRGARSRRCSTRSGPTSS